MMPPRVNPWIQLVALFGTFAASGFVGLWLASWAAPGSGVAAAISGMLLPAAFAAGLLVWAGFDFMSAVVDLLRGRRARASTSPVRAGRWFVPLSLAFNSAGGLLVGLIPGGEGVITTVAAYAAAGTAYGLLVARLAARGYLPAPDTR